MKKILPLLFAILFLIPSKCYAFTTDYKNNQFSSKGGAYIGRSTGDPFIIYDNGYYYVYATGLLNGKRTKDFKKWENTKDKTSYDYNNRENFWAPEVFKYGDYYYKIFSSFKKNSGVATIGLASSKSLNSSFTVKTYDILGSKFYNSVIDADILIDGNNQYLYFAEDQIKKNGTPTSSIYGIQIKLSNGNCSVVGDAHFLKAPDTDYEKKSLYTIGGIWNEGPSVIKHNSKYYLMYSSNFWASADYNVSYVVSDSPLGPYYRPSGSNVLLESVGSVIGPGHNNVFKSPSGELYTVYHVKDPSSTESGWQRSLAFDRIGFVGDKLFVNGPTYESSQSLPSGISNYVMVKPSSSNTPNLFNTLNNFSSLGGSQKIAANTKINIEFSSSKRIKAIFLYPDRFMKTSSAYTAKIILNGKNSGSKSFTLRPNFRSGIALTGDYNIKQMSISFSKDIFLSEIMFIADTPKSISINTKPTKLTYVQNSQNLSVAGGKINVNYYNTPTPRVVNMTSSMISGFNNKNLGLQTLTVTYGNFKTKYSVNIIKKKVSSIKVTKGLTKTTYIQNYNNLSLTGGVVIVTYNDKTTKNIPMSSCTVTGFDNKTLGTKTLKISYEGVTTTYNVTIVKKSKIGIEIKEPSKYYYIKNEQNLNVSDGRIFIKYNDGTKSNEIKMTSSMVSGFDNNGIGQECLKVKYDGFTAEFFVEIIEMVTSDKYTINHKKGYIYTKLDTKSSTILSNLKMVGTNFSKTINNGQVIIKNSGLTKNYKILNITQTDYNLTKEYIYTRMSDFDISKIKTNCTLSNVNNVLRIGYDGDVFESFKLLKIKSTNQNCSLYPGFVYNIGNFDINQINYTRDSKFSIRKNNDKLEVIYNNNIIDSYYIIQMNFGNLKVKDNVIILDNPMPYDNFINNIRIDGALVNVCKDYNCSTKVTSGNVTKGMILQITKSYPSAFSEKNYLITDEYVNVDDLEIDKNGFISKFSQGTKYQEILNNIKTNGNIKFEDSNGRSLQSNDIIRTGSKVVIRTGTETKEYTIVVYGDADGDGRITINDVTSAANYIFTSEKNCYKEASDVTRDGITAINDVKEIANLIFTSGLKIE